jgi:hypothetical protein
MAEATPPLPIEPSVPAVLAVIAGLVGLGVVLGRRGYGTGWRGPAGSGRSGASACGWPSAGPG